MADTEQGMWKALRDTAANKAGGLVKLTRIETGDTALGVSDVEYINQTYCGWIENKVLVTSRSTSTFMFNSPFTLQQFQWLVEHHRPKRNILSWLLVGKPKASQGWESWFMLPAPCTHRLLKTLRPTTGEVLHWPEVVVVTTPSEVLQRLAQGI